MSEAIKLILLAIVLMGVALLMVEHVYSYDYELNYSFNESQLPVNQSINLSLSSVANSSADFVLFNKSDALSLQYGSVFYFNESGEFFGSLNFSVEDYSFEGNESLSALFNLSSNDTNGSKSFYIGISLIDDEVHYVVVEGFVVSIVNNRWEINMTENFLPKNGSLSFVISGLNASNASMGCTGWLNCPSIIFFNASNQSMVIVNYSIPFNASLGVYTYSVSVNRSNSTDSQDVIFRVLPEEVIFKEYVWEDRCFDSDGNVVWECVEEFVEYQTNTMIEYLSRVKGLCENRVEVENYTVTEYVVVGDLDSDVYDSWKACTEDLKDMTSLKLECDGGLNRANGLIDECRSDLMINESDWFLNLAGRIADEQSKRIEEKKFFEEEKSGLDKTHRKFIWWYVIVVVVVSGAAILGLSYWSKYSKYSWRR